jgi:hypothetical protein
MELQKEFIPLMAIFLVSVDEMRGGILQGF